MDIFPIDIHTETPEKGNKIVIMGTVNIKRLEGSAPYGGLLLAPVKGWWPLATCQGPFGLLGG